MEIIVVYFFAKMTFLIKIHKLVEAVNIKKMFEFIFNT